MNMKGENETNQNYSRNVTVGVLILRATARNGRTPRARRVLEWTWISTPLPQTRYPDKLI